MNAAHVLSLFALVNQYRCVEKMDGATASMRLKDVKVPENQETKAQESGNLCTKLPILKNRRFAEVHMENFLATIAFSLIVNSPKIWDVDKMAYVRHICVA
jgi:hypothetical protein